MYNSLLAKVVLLHFSKCRLHPNLHVSWHGMYVQYSFWDSQRQPLRIQYLHYLEQPTYVSLCTYVAVIAITYSLRPHFHVLINIQDLENHDLIPDMYESLYSSQPSLCTTVWKWYFMSRCVLMFFCFQINYTTFGENEYDGVVIPMISRRREISGHKKPRK